MSDTITCRAVQANGRDCTHPAKGRIYLGSTPVCGKHLRAAEQRGEETGPL